MVYWGRCPHCELIVAHWVTGLVGVEGGQLVVTEPTSKRLVLPPTADRPVPPEVPNNVADDYREAALTLSLSPKASAAISRRCLQNLIRQKTGEKKPTLEMEIDGIIEAKLVSSTLADQLHAVRQIGNFAAHPTKDTDTGSILDVEPGEAEWNLEILDGMFDEWYVQPAKALARRDAMNEKLTKAGKPTI